MEKLEEVLGAPYGSVRVCFAYHGVMVGRNHDSTKFHSYISKTTQREVEYPLYLDKAKEYHESLSKAVELMEKVESLNKVWYYSCTSYNC